ncbi:MAG: patatin-like phospholipase family protein [Alphaproteobacteria bacterium]
MTRIPIGTNEHDIEELRAWYPSERTQPDRGHFEIGLVLAGAVSAGAYTAGAMDFLIEALDRWSLAKDANDKSVPNHDVILKVITGASAGGINGAIAAAALDYDFPPVYPAEKHDKLLDEEKSRILNAEGSSSGNPFYDTWVTGIDIKYFLKATDLEDGLLSFLDCNELEEIARRTVDFTGTKLSDVDRARRRHWLDNPLTLMLTVANLRGVPYTIAFGGATRLGHEMKMHRDHVTFAISGLSDRDLAPHYPAPDVIELKRPNQYEGRWIDLAQTALATGAFPLFLRPRPLKRNGAHYDYRALVVPNPPATEVPHHVPHWPSNQAPNPYGYLCVDGGAMNNEPFDLARKFLAGSQGRNPREGAEATRAVVLIDPFSDPGPLGPEDTTPLSKVGMSLFGAWKEQARFKEEDLALARVKQVYSRFLVAPTRGIKNQRGSDAIASGALSGFMGFMSEGYRRHDYLLGRRNCQRFLADHFTLPLDNKLFDVWPEGMKERWIDERRSNDLDPTHLPIIPLVGHCAEEEPLPHWPKGKFRADSINADIETRVAAVYKTLKKELANGLETSADPKKPEGFFSRTWRKMKNKIKVASANTYVATGWMFAKPTLMKKINEQIAAAVKAIDERQ